MSSKATTSENPVKPPGAGRPPSLNQLAARINPMSTATTSAPRPRLAASLLRTGSNASLSTVASTNDSVAVNAPSSTRSASPAGISKSPPRSITPVGDALTAEKLAKLNQETVPSTVVPEKRAVKVGYKNIPSLDAITARLAKTRTLSIDGSAKPPEPEMIEDPKTPGVPIKAPEHPLQFAWYDSFVMLNFCHQLGIYFSDAGQYTTIRKPNSHTHQPQPHRPPPQASKPPSAHTPPSRQTTRPV
jgi:translation initiation factor 4E